MQLNTKVGYRSGRIFYRSIPTTYLTLTLCVFTNLLYYIYVIFFNEVQAKTSQYKQKESPLQVHGDPFILSCVNILQYQRCFSSLEEQFRLVLLPLTLLCLRLSDVFFLKILTLGRKVSAFLDKEIARGYLCSYTMT